MNIEDLDDNPLPWSADDLEVMIYAYKDRRDPEATRIVLLAQEVLRLREYEYMYRDLADD